MKINDSAALCLLKLMTWIRAPVASQVPNDDIGDTRFFPFFGRNTEEYRRIINEHARYSFGISFDGHTNVSKENSAVPMFFYSYTYLVLRENLTTAMKTIQIEKLNFSMKVSLFAVLRFADMSDENLRKSILESGATDCDKQALFEVFLHAHKLLDAEVFQDVLQKLDCEFVVGQVSHQLQKTNIELERKADLLHFLTGLLVLNHVPEEKYLGVCNSFMSRDFIESFTDFEKKILIPNDEVYTKLWSALSVYQVCALRGEKEENGQNLSDALITKVLAGLELILNREQPVLNQRDPLLFAVKKSFYQEFVSKNWVKYQLFDTKLPAQLQPAIIFEDGAQTKLLFLLQPGQREEDVSCLLTRELIKWIMAPARNNHTFLFKPLSSFLRDPLFYVSFDFSMNLRKPEATAILKEFVARGSELDKLEQKLAQLVQKATFERKEVASHVGGLMSKVIAVVGTGSGHHREALDQLAEALFSWMQKIYANDSDQLHLLDALKEEYKQFSKAVVVNAAPAPNTLPFFGKRFGLEGVRQADKPRPNLFEFLNLDLLFNSEYVLFDSWRELLKTHASPLDFHETSETLTTKFGQLKKVLLPSPHGRSQVKVSDFALFWEQAGSEYTKSANFFKYEDMAHGESRIGRIPFQVCVLNLLYEFRLLDDHEDFLKRLFALPFWSKLARRLNEPPKNS